MVKFWLNILQNPDLLKWFKDFVGMKEGGGGVTKEAGSTVGLIKTEGGAPESTAPPHQPLSQPRHDRMSGDAAMEIGKINDYPNSIWWTKELYYHIFSSKNITLNLVLYGCMKIFFFASIYFFLPLN